MTVYAIIAAIIAVSSVFAAVQFLNTDSEAKVVYYDGETVIDEVSGSGDFILKEMDLADLGSRTFFGWSDHPLHTGERYDPGHSLSVKGTKNLYAAVVDGIMVHDGKGEVNFDLGYTPVGNVIIDMRFIENIDVLKISSNTMKNMPAGMTIIYPDGTEIALDSKMVTGCNGILTADTLSLTKNFADGEGSVGLYNGDPAFVGGIMGSGFTGAVIMKVPESVLGSGFTHVIDETVGKVTDHKKNNGLVEFSLSGLSYSVVELYEFKVIGTDGTVIPEASVDYPDVTTTSEYFGKYGLFAAGDTFELSELPTGFNFDVTGVSYNSDSSYTVNGKGDVVATYIEGKYMVYLPEPDDPVRYTITADPMVIEPGSRCILTYSLKAGYIDDDLVIKVNGVVVKKDGTSRIFIDNVNSNLVVEVSGIYDVRMYKVVLPEEQVGYTLTSTEDAVHHGEAYSLTFKLLKDHECGPDFGIYISGSLLTTEEGTIEVKDVQGEQKVTVEGVRLIEYDVSVGNNITATVDGLKVTKVTCQDKVTIAPVDGYTMPSDYDSYIPVTAHSSAGSFTYTLTGGTVFPGVVKITPGDHTKADGSTDAFCVSSAKAITLSSVTGYKLPEDYSEKVQSLAGVTKSGTKYLFAQDAELPSVYKVEFKGLKDEIVTGLTMFLLSGTQLSVFNIEKPTYSLDTYDFKGWDYDGQSVSSDLQIKSIWTPKLFKITFGVNLSVSLYADKELLTTHNINDTPKQIEIYSNYTIKLSIWDDGNTVIITDDTKFYTPSCLVNSSGDYFPISDGSVSGISKIEYYVQDNGVYLLKETKYSQIGIDYCLWNPSDNSINIDYWATNSGDKVSGTITVTDALYKFYGVVKDNT